MKNSAAEPSYWPSVAFSALVIGFLYFLVSTIGGYATIAADVDGALTALAGQAVAAIGGCLLAAFSGMMAIWHYCRRYDVSLTLGKGALIGFLAGAATAIFSTLLSQLWLVIDPTYAERMLNNLVSVIDNVDGFTEAQRTQMVDSLAADYKSGFNVLTFFSNMLFSAIPLGLVNVITGMLGVKFFATQKNILDE